MTAALPTSEPSPEAIVLQLGTAAPDGRGWYWLAAEYPDEGVCGAFATRDAAALHAREQGYAVEVTQ